MEQLPRSQSSTDRVLRTIAPGRRRHILRYLADRAEDDVTLRHLAAELANDSVAEGGLDVTALETELHHADVPAMAEAGLLEYDDEDHVVEYVAPEEVERLVSFVGEHVE